MRPQSILWCSREAAIITGGQNSAEWQATGISLNIEKMQPGDLFIAGPNDNLKEVWEKGAAAVLTDESAAVHPCLPILKVRDVYVALRQLAAAARFRTHGLVIAVQGRQDRKDLAGLLSITSGVHEGGKHLSRGLASMPEDICYGVFSFSPSVRPDVAVITDGRAALQNTVIESLPDHGIVFLNAEDPDFVAVMARAKASGIRNIFTFGRAEFADARIREHICGANGQRLHLDICGEEVSFNLSSGFNNPAALLATCLMLKAGDQSLQRYARWLSASVRQASLSKTNIQLFEATAQVREAAGMSAIFQVKQRIDYGAARRTLVLDNVRPPSMPAVSARLIDIPNRLNSQELVWAHKEVSWMPNERAGNVLNTPSRRLEKIVPDVLVPGDFVVFKEIWNKSCAVFEQALRLVPAATARQGS